MPLRRPRQVRFTGSCARTQSAPSVSPQSALAGELCYSFDVGCAPVIQWLKHQDVRASYQATEITLDQQGDWFFDGWEIRHRLNRFFSVAGFEYQNGRSCRTQPLIVQPEIGCLGWVTRGTGSETEFLLQAKYEPGNCNGTQIAPTVQATKSNQDRVHGGSAVPFLDVFQQHGPRPVVDELQTEESDRFFRKLNRNVAVQILGELPHAEQFHWCSLPTLKRLLTLSHTVNTDARSALACMDWKLFQDRSPTDRFLTPALRRSRDLDLDTPAALQRLDDARAGFGRVRQVSLSQLPGWRLTPLGLESPDGPFSIRYFRIRSQLREVPEWSQPLLVSRSPGLCLLAISIKKDGIARVYLRSRQAPGVLNGAEIGPSLQFSPGECPDRLDSVDDTMLRLARQGRLLVEADNSQEGSRFFKDSTRYRVTLIDDSQMPDTHDSGWATLGTLKNLIDRGGIISNELRSTVSFLLPLL
jgi:oxidase EvaA